MDDENMYNMQSFLQNPEYSNKMSKMTDYCSNENPGYVPDPYYGGEAGFEHVRIIASGGFTEQKIRQFEEQGVPVDAYGVGSSLLHGHGEFDFTADVVQVNGTPCGKVGRPLIPNELLELVE